MPHIIVEYSRNLESRFSVPALLKNLHETLGAHESIDIARVKTRAIPLDHFIVGTENKPMIHITLKLMPRNSAVMKKMAMAMQTITKQYVPEASITAEVVLLDKDTYCL